MAVFTPLLETSDEEWVQVIIESVSGAKSSRRGRVSDHHGTIKDPGSNDTFTVTIDWGDGSSPTNAGVYPAGTTQYPEQHLYVDEDPSATSSDDYGVKVTVTDTDTDTDKDGGFSEATTTVTVNNVVPRFSAPMGSTISEHGIANVSVTIVNDGARDTLLRLKAMIRRSQVA